MFLDEKGVIFLSNYDPLNFKIGEALCQNKFSLAGFWGEENLKQHKLDYMSVFSASASDFGNKSLIIPSYPDSEAFLEDVFGIITKAEFEPHYIIAKGTSLDFWPIPAIKKQFNLDSTFVLILDSASHPIEDFELSILNAFDIIFSMGPSSDIVLLSHKTIPVFNIFESSLFNNNPCLEGDNFHSNNGSDFPIILCSTENFEEISKNPELDHKIFSFLDIKKCPQEELAIYLGLSKCIVDYTDIPEVKWLLKKVGKNSISLKEYFGKDRINNIEQNDIKKQEENLEEFSGLLKNKISDKLEIEQKSQIVLGLDI